jgi:hypothetical protein
MKKSVAPSHKEVKEAFEVKKSADTFWNHTFSQYLNKKADPNTLILAMDYSNKIDKELIEKYGIKILKQFYLKENT